MGDQAERRSSQLEMDMGGQAEGYPGQGVGGRQAPLPPPGQGGGYLGTGTVSKFSPALAAAPVDPRLEELRAMRLQPRWLRIAEEIGVENFMAMWRILDADPALRTDDGDLLFKMRSFKSYLRFQRNRYIESLRDQGLGRDEIQLAIKRDLCEVISLRHISRLKSGK